MKVGLNTVVGFMCTLSFLAGYSVVRADPIERPAGPRGASTEVRVQVVLLDVDEIRTADQTFVANLYYAVRWRDPRLADSGLGTRVLPLAEIWHPNFLFVNQQRIMASFPESATVTSDGEVLYRQRVWGPFSQPLNLRDFPFDRQAFTVRLLAAGHGPEEVRVMTDPANPSGLAASFSQPDWDILSWRLDLTSYAAFQGDTANTSFALVFEAARKKNYFILKLILPLVLVVAMSWVVFWINPRESGTQISVAATSMLTLIAYRFTLAEKMPPVSYFTRMDYFVLVATLLVFAALVQAVGTAKLAAAGRVQTAVRIDRWCRVLFPAFLAAAGVLCLAL